MRWTCHSTYALFNASEKGLLGEGLLALGQPPLSERFKPACADYLKRMMERPGWQAAMRVCQESAEVSGT